MARPALLLAAALSCACGREERGAPPAAEALDPAGYYVRTRGPNAAFTVTRLPNRNWVVETEGTPPGPAPANACRTAAVGSLAGATLAATSDVDRDTPGIFTEEGMAPYQGLIIRFSGTRATVSGPEARGSCDLRGTYERRPPPAPDGRAAAPDAGQNTEPRRN